MGEDKLELFVKNKLDNYQSPINTDDLWNSIQNDEGYAGIAETSAAVETGAKMNSLKWIAGSILIISLMSLAYWTGTQKSQNSFSNVQTESINNVGQAQNNSGEIILAQNVITPAEEVNLKNASAPITQSTNTTATISAITIQNKPQQSYIDNQNQVNTATPFKSKTIVNGIAPNNSDDNQGISNNAESIILGLNDMNSTESTTITISDTKTQSILSDKFTFESKTNTIFATNYLNSKIITLENSPYSLDEKFAGLPDKIVCPSFGGSSKRGQLSAELQVIPLYSTPLFRFDDERGEEWVARKKETESYLEAFQINLLGRYQMRNGLYVHTGIGYGQIDEKFQFNTENVEVITEDNIPVIIILRPNGVSDTIRGNAQVSITNSFGAETYNYHRMIELPFALGYEFTTSQSTGIYVDFGGSVNLSTFRKGYLVVDDVDVVSFDDQTRPVYTTSTGFKLNGGLGMRYHMVNGLSFSIGPEFRYHTNNWIRDEHPIEQRYFDVGLRLATAVRF